MTDQDKKKFNIQLASQMSGLSAHTIRAWEKRYKALTPSRNENGRRLYTTKEIDRLVILSQLTQLGTNIGQIAHLSDEELKKAYDKLNQAKDQDFQIVKPLNTFDTSTIKSQLLDAVEKYQVDIISQLLSLSKTSFTPKIFALDILEPVINEVRGRKEKSLIQDAQAQALYAIVKFHAGNIIYSHFEKAQKSTSKIVLTSVEKEHHTFPLLLSALLCCHHKKHFYYLNSNLPAVSMIDAIRATESNHLILSLPSWPFNPEVISILDEVINEVSATTKTWLLGDVGEKNLKISKWKNTKLVKNHKELDSLLEGTI